ncbi:MAG TPA: prepilin-type N-terminal cleavage/methylation domain-containing protein [Opitutales bacterium]|nr:prepilin-type N-terminal cleavage/methylation domain-containing protein [Opitutales bacterium]
MHYRRAFSLLELLLAMGLSACVLGGLGYWMLQGSRLADTIQLVLADKGAIRGLEQALRLDFAQACTGSEQPWLVYKDEAQKIFFEMHTTQGAIRYELAADGGAIRTGPDGCNTVLVAPSTPLSASVWARSSRDALWAVLEPGQVSVIGDRATFEQESESYIFGWLELISTSGPQRVIHRFRSLY